MTHLIEIAVAFLSGCVVGYLNRERVQKLLRDPKAKTPKIDPPKDIKPTPKLRLIKGNKK